MATVTACLGCGTQTRHGSYCTACAPGVEKRRHNSAYDSGEWRRLRAEAIQAHVERYGWLCIGDDQHGAHQTTDLTVDHPVALANGGTHDQELHVCCRSSNSRKGAR
jgi:5-methylcytosine-specific restriction endonuclease McrA